MTQRVLNRRYTYPAISFIFDRMSPAYSLTREFSISRRRVSFTQVSESAQASKKEWNDTKRYKMRLFDI